MYDHAGSWRQIRKLLSIEEERTSSLASSYTSRAKRDISMRPLAEFWMVFAKVQEKARARINEYAKHEGTRYAIPPASAMRELGYPAPENRAIVWWDFIPPKLREKLQQEYSFMTQYMKNPRQLFRMPEDVTKDRKMTRYHMWLQLRESILRENARIREALADPVNEGREAWLAYQRQLLVALVRVAEYVATLEKGKNVAEMQAYLMEMVPRKEQTPKDWRDLIVVAKASHLMPDPATLTVTPEQRDADDPLIIDPAIPPQFASQDYVNSLPAVKAMRAMMRVPAKRGRPKGKKDSYQRKRTAKHVMDAYREKWK